MLNIFIFSFFIACISYVYNFILSDKLLSFWFKFGYDNIYKHQFNKCTGKKTIVWYLYQPIFNCELCFSGQVALWYYFYLFESYNLFFHISFIAVSIIQTKILAKIL